MNLSVIRLGAAVCGLALSLAAGAGIASADPATDPIVNTTCSYDQAVAALNAENPQAAAEFNSSPQAQAALGQFLSAPRSRRAIMAQQIQSSPYFPVMQQIAATCNNY
ncbi:hemophore-related protein [Mycobacterium sp. MFM001]|uniref:hemophore-related protein n=1 Tax=Mycobacterium sp. MFM001 TaxID=2049453 RepID=UPI001EDD0D88|nr:hemophore-related protein [Mycobacterium sp. MFM001]